MTIPLELGVFMQKKCQNWEIYNYLATPFSLSLNKPFYTQSILYFLYNSVIYQWQQYFTSNHYFLYMNLSDSFFLPTLGKQ